MPGRLYLNQACRIAQPLARRARSPRLATRVSTSLRLDVIGIRQPLPVLFVSHELELVQRLRSPAEDRTETELLLTNGDCHLQPFVAVALIVYHGNSASEVENLP